ncbi:MAG: hypothetical protein ACE5I2_07335 [Anaerolineae bacterium]
MTEIKYNYDREADVLYVSFGRSKHVTGVERPQRSHLVRWD